MTGLTDAEFHQLLLHFQYAWDQYVQQYYVDRDSRQRQYGGGRSDATEDKLLFILYYEVLQMTWWGTVYTFFLALLMTVGFVNARHLGAEQHSKSNAIRTFVPLHKRLNLVDPKQKRPFAKSRRLGCLRRLCVYTGKGIRLDDSTLRFLCGG